MKAVAENDYPNDEAYYPQLLRVARSAGLNLAEDRSRDDLVTRLRDAGVDRVGYEEWEQGGEPLELEPSKSSGSAGPTDKSILYCLTRKETTEDRVERIRSALEDKGFEVREAGSENDKYAIVLPAEVQDDEDGNATNLDEMTKEELYDLASERNIDGRSEMTKSELTDALSELLG